MAVGATIYFGSDESQAPDRRGLGGLRGRARARPGDDPLVLPAQLRVQRTKDGGPDYHLAADLTGQANHLGVTIEADIIKQKLPEVAAPGFLDLDFGKTDKRVYTELMTPHPIDMTRYQLANCYMGRSGLINSGGASGDNDLQDAVRTAVINKRAGGTGLISGRKAFQRPLAEGVELLNAIQDVYLCARGHGRVTDPLVASEGWGVIHCYFRLRGDAPNAIVVAADIESARRRVVRRARRLPGELDGAARRSRRPRPDADRAGPRAARALPLAHCWRTSIGATSRAGARARLRLDDRARRVHAARGLARSTWRCSSGACTRGCRASACSASTRWRSAARRGDNWYSLDFEERRDADGRPRQARREVLGPRDPADHRRDRSLRLGVGRDAAQRRPEGHQGHRLRDALRQVSSRYGVFGPFTVGLVVPLREAFEIARLTVVE